MSKIFQKPLTPEQIKASQEISGTKIRQAQDALFMFLLNRVAELEAKIQSQPPAEVEGKIHLRNLK